MNNEIYEEENERKLRKNRKKKVIRNNSPKCYNPRDVSERNCLCAH